MKVYDKLYIGGEFVAPLGTETIEVINSSTEEVAGRVELEGSRLGSFEHTEARERPKHAVESVLLHAGLGRARTSVPDPWPTGMPGR